MLRINKSPETILYSYRTYIRPLLEYSCILFTHASDDLLRKIQAVETQAIKIAYRLAPWASNTSCHNLTNFPKITERLKSLAIKFVTDNKEDDLIKNIKPSMTGYHSPLYKYIKFKLGKPSLKKRLNLGIGPNRGGGLPEVLLVPNLLTGVLKNTQNALKHKINT